MYLGYLQTVFAIFLSMPGQQKRPGNERFSLEPHTHTQNQLPTPNSRREILVFENPRKGAGY